MKMLLAESRLGVTVEKALAEIVGREHVSRELVDRMNYARDIWPRQTILMQEYCFSHPPDLVVWPGSVEEVQKIVRFCGGEGIPLVPMGAGSGVCGGAVAVRGGIIMDLKRLNRVLSLDQESLLVTAQTGIVGEIFERRLNEQGYTLGHFPSSIYCSTLGGWLAARSAGQLSAKYGKIEDMVVSLEAVLPNGELLRTKTTPRSATGPNWTQALVGSEGTLAVITAATLRIWPYPQSRLFQGFMFPNTSAGLNAMREMMQSELRPAALRLYDAVDTLFSSSSGSLDKESRAGKETKSSLSALREMFGDWPRRVVPYVLHPRMVNNILNRLARQAKMVLTFEGEEQITRVEKELARKICLACAAVDMGEGPARHWWEKRYKVSYTMQVMFDLGLFVDTIEVATLWDNLERLYHGMSEAIAEHALVMAHFSHAYPQGCSIYFSIASADKGLEKRLARYDRIWEAALEACVKYKGTISHHHGVGLLKARWMRQEQGGTHPIARCLKAAMDPQGIMNPGKMGNE